VEIISRRKQVERIIMADIVSLVKGDTVANLKVSLVREDNGTAFGVADADSVKLYIRKKGTTALIDTVEKDNLLSTEAQGLFVFKLGAPGKFLTLAGITEGYYEAEVELTFDTDSTIQTVFDTITFRVRDDFS
jgi:hypothetical protein